VARARQDQQRERHDREAAELDESAHPHEGYAAPAQRRAVMIRAKAHERADRRIEHGQRHHDRHQRRGHAKLDDHHPVQGADQQH